jgi:hypothetical protein
VRADRGLTPQQLAPITMGFFTFDLKSIKNLKPPVVVHLRSGRTEYVHTIWEEAPGQN